MSVQIVWAACPNDWSPPGTTSRAGKLRLSVALSPRLSPPGGVGTLSMFPEFLDWPATLSMLALQVLIDGTLASATIVTDPAPRSDLWMSMFPPSSPVRAPDFTDLSGKRFASYPMSEVAGFLRNRYAQLATMPASAPGSDHPSVGEFSQAFGILRGLKGFDQYLDQAQVVPPSDPNEPERTRIPRAFAQLRRFHRPFHPNDRMAGPWATPVEKPKPDFHQAVALTGQHPTLQRLLGLVVDLEVELSPNALLPANVDVRVVVPTADPGIEHRSPRTASRITTQEFRARSLSGTPSVAAGYLPFHDASNFELIQVDVDGAALKTLGTVETLIAMGAKPSVDTPEDLTAPALRSAGLSIALRGRSVQLLNTVNRGKGLDGALRGGADPTLFSEDITRGYRFDLWDSNSGVWHSLHERKGTLSFPSTGDTVAVATEEGFLEAVTTSSGDPADDEQRIAESLFRWDNWSLSVPPVGRTLNTDVSDPNNLSIEPSNAPEPGDFQFQSSYAVLPGSLPRARFGLSYRARCRLTDLAGNSVLSSSDAFATPPIVFGRFDPVQTPPVLPRKPRTVEGEALEKLVLRSVVGPEGGGPYALTTERHLAPPKTSVQMSELLGMLDETIPGPRVVLDKDAYPMVVARDLGSFATSAEAMIDPEDHGGTGYFDVDVVTVPYLPDPFARGLALKGLPGALGVRRISFRSQDWPAMRSVRFVLREGGASNAIDDADGVILVRLPKAETARIRISAYLDPADVERMGLLGWVGEEFPAFDLNDIMSQAIRGQHWLLTPWRELDLVHAVKIPLASVEFGGLSAGRNKGDTFAVLRDKAAFHRKSTSTIDLRGAWNEWIDRGAGSDPPTIDVATTEAREAAAFQVHADRPPNADTVLVLGDHQNDRHEFGDTKHRNVTYAAIAATRFAEHFVMRKLIAVPAVLPHVEVLDPMGLVAGSVEIRLGGTNGALAAEGTDYTADLVAGSVTFPGTSGIAGEIVQIRYLPLPIQVTTQVPATIPIPSSARPTVPSPLYVVPAFSWDGISTGGGVTSHRRGDSMRIYLERPWWTSGEGELLGVVTWRRPTPSAELDSATYQRFVQLVTQWGLDPVFSGDNLPSRYPTASSFPDRVDQGLALRTAELAPADLVDVAGHEVRYDSSRDLWYCDLQVANGARFSSPYTPFIRLALARFQPNSLPGCELSPIVLADFIQLAPDRSASISYVSDTELLVTLTGPTYDSSGAGPSGGFAQAIIEERDSTGNAGQDVGWRPVGNPTTLTRASDRWQGQVVLPSSRASGNFRIALEQFEVHSTDGATGGFSFASILGPVVPTGRRLVYSDIIQIS